jgi:hypothetical protein
MKKIIKSSLSVALATLMSISMFAQAGEAVADDHSSAVSYNIGYMSEYWYRGVLPSQNHQLALALMQRWVTSMLVHGGQMLTQV